MKLSPTIGTLALLAVLTLPASPAPAAYSQPASTFSAGGGVSSSTSYTNLGVIGQPGIVGTSTGTSYSANHGFLHVLGDGFKLLYPVIAVEPGTLTFNLVSNSSSNQPMSVTNTGGSTLAWTITKDPLKTYFTVDPASGTGDNPGIQVTANTNGLGIGTYTDTLIISGAGIEKTAQLLLTLNVIAPSSYKLTVTVISDHATKGGGAVNDGTGIIACSNTGNNPLTQSGTCEVDLQPDTSITLHQLADSDSTVATWGGGTCTGTGDCAVTEIAADTTVTATFPYAYMAQINAGTKYDSLDEAYTNAAATDTIKLRGVPFDTPVTFSGGKIITLYGGFDNYYQTPSGSSTIQGPLTVRSGMVIPKGINVKPATAK